MTASNSKDGNVIVIDEEDPGDCYRKNVGIMLLNKDDMVFSGKQGFADLIFNEMPASG